uniref:Uncharacterized protein n=1 Tax=Peronospora matthiolae TaxID=2874970 RepID=A0AAV1UKW7_9STRA
MKITALAIIALATVKPTAPIAGRTCLAAPTKQQSSSPVEAAAAAANTEHDVDDDSKKAQGVVGTTGMGASLGRLWMWGVLGVGTVVAGSGYGGGWGW